MFSNLWNAQDGGVITTELVLVASVLTATLVTGLSSLRTHVQSEFNDLGQRLHQASEASVAPQSSVPPASQEITGTAFAGDVHDFLTDQGQWR